MLAAALAALALYLLVLALAAYIATHPPRSPIFLSPVALGAPMEEVEFSSRDGTLLRGWWVPAENARGVAILLHGYVMNRSENAALATEMRRWGFSCLLFDFRNCGRSGGAVTTVGHNERLDVLGACDYVADRKPGAKRALIGSSMGAAAAAFALAEEPDCADALVLDSCYSSLPSATLGWWRWLGGMPLVLLLAPVVIAAMPIARFNPYRADVGRALRKVRRPTLIVHGTEDAMVHPRHAERNLRLAACAEVRWMPDVGHGEARWSTPHRLYETLYDFLTPLFPEE